MIIFKDKLLIFNLLSFILALLTAISILFLADKLPLRIPLFYSLSWGENQLALLPQFLIVPSVMVFITLVNLIIFWQLHDNQILFKQVLTISSLVTSIILVVTFIKIILIF